MPKSYHVILDITVPDEPGAKPDIKIDAGGLQAQDLLFHVANVAEVIRLQVIRAAVLHRLGLNPDGSKRIVEAHEASGPWTPPR